MNIGIPDGLRKPLYVVLVVIGVVVTVAAQFAPSVLADASTTVDRISSILTSIFGLLPSYAGTAALIHFTPSSPPGSPNQNAPADPPPTT